MTSDISLADRIKAIKGVNTVTLSLYHHNQEIEQTPEMSIEAAIAHMRDTSSSMVNGHAWRFTSSQWWDGQGIDHSQSDEVRAITDEIYERADA